MKIKSFECPKYVRNYEKKNIWNVRCLVDDSFVPSAQQTSILYCRLSDFWKSVRSVVDQISVSFGPTNLWNIPTPFSIVAKSPLPRDSLKLIRHHPRGGRVVWVELYVNLRLIVEWVLKTRKSVLWLACTPHRSQCYVHM